MTPQPTHKDWLHVPVQAADVTTDVFIFFTCPLHAGNCTAAQVSSML
jgi:hypothetical protein